MRKSLTQHEKSRAAQKAEKAVYIDDPYVNLQAGIIEKAVEDYEIAIFFDNEDERKKLKKWFKSIWGQFICNGSGEFIEQRVSAEMKQLLGAVTAQKDNLIITNIEATAKRREHLKKRQCHFKVNENGFFTFRSYRSFKRSIENLKKAKMLSSKGQGN